MTNIVYVVKYHQSDPWYSPAFGAVFTDIRKAKKWCEDNQYSEWDRENGIQKWFKWEYDQLFELEHCEWDDEEDDEWRETDTFIDTVPIDPE